MSTPLNPPAPQERMFQMIVGYFVSQIAYTFSRLSIAEAVGEGATESQLISKLAKNPDASARFLHACVGIELLSYQGGTYRLTELGTLLHSQTPGNLKSFAAAIPAESHWRPWQYLADALATGKSPLAKTLGGDVWAYFNQNPAELEFFANAMGDLSNIAASQAVKAYDFSRFSKIIDVGGSHGVVLAHLLKAAPKARGVLFDLPSVTANAGAELGRWGVGGRVEVLGGNFFEGVPAGGDLYVMKHIIHDWDDARAVTILRNCSCAAAGGATLVLLELVLPDTPVAAPVPYLMDLNMLVMVDGRERNPAQYRALMAEAGWKLNRVVPTEGAFSIIEATKA